ncbi:MAG: isopeptide-forming domain-containing fimbrial protein, partial [Bacilli bacterium]|nr:isopeptide-forming domain-containing fimbrial protein [Bacilli bacterium]
SDIGNAPRIQGKRTIYITNMTNYTVNINDKKNFEFVGAEIKVKEKLKKSKTYTNPFSIVFNNAGYYINDNGDTVYVNVIVNADSLYMYLPGDYSSKVHRYRVAIMSNNYFWIEAFAYNSSGGSASLGNKYIGEHFTLTFKVTKTDGSDIDASVANNMMIPWYLWDLDVPDKTNGTSYASGKTYRESIKFVSGFDNKTYVRNKTKLAIESNNSKYLSTTYTGDTGQPASEYSTVVAYQTSPSAKVEWWGSGCGTAFQIRASSFDYPYIKKGSKTADKKVYNVGQTVSYTVKQKFPYTIDSNMAQSITVTDKFDSALDISGLTTRIYNGSGLDVTNSWKITISGQTVTITYNKTDFKNVVGEYTFTFSNIKVKQPDSSHASARMSKVDG